MPVVNPATGIIHSVSDQRSLAGLVQIAFWSARNCLPVLEKPDYGLDGRSPCFSRGTSLCFACGDSTCGAPPSGAAPCSFSCCGRGAPARFAVNVQFAMMSPTNMQNPLMTFQWLLSWMDVSDRECHGSGNLRRLNHWCPVADCYFRRLLRHNDRVARQEHGAHRIAGPHAAVILCGENGAVGANDEDGLLVCELGHAARLSQVPLRTSSGNISNGRGVVDLPVHEHVARFFRHHDHIAFS